MSEVSTGSTVTEDSGKKGGGAFFLVIVIAVAVLFAVMWGMAQKSAADAKKQLESADGRIAAADRKRADAEKQIAEARTANDRVAAVQRDLDAAKKETADIRAERDRLMGELAQAKKDAETFQSRIVEMEAASKKPATPDAAPETPKKGD